MALDGYRAFREALSSSEILGFSEIFSDLKI